MASKEQVLSVKEILERLRSVYLEEISYDYSLIAD